MIKLKIDDTGVIFNSMKELAKFLGCSYQNVQQCKDYKSDKHNHFWCRDYGITILESKKENTKAEMSRTYYRERHKSKNVCPFCKSKLKLGIYRHNTCLYYCPNLDCDESTDLVGTQEMWWLVDTLIKKDTK